MNDGLLDSVIDNVQTTTTTTQETVPEDLPSEQQMCRDVFMTSSIDGGLTLWDRRRDKMVARLAPGPKGTPPWCMSVSSLVYRSEYKACWSTNGDLIYVGRRNGTVDEYSMHKPTSPPVRTFRFPGNSGRVTSVAAMPNGRNLIWYIFFYLG